MKIMKFENIRNGKNVYIDTNFIEYHSLLYIYDENRYSKEQYNEDDLNLSYIEFILLNGEILASYNILEQMEFVENNFYNNFLILMCSYSDNFENPFIIYIKLEVRGEVSRIGKTKFIIRSNEHNHINTPHFHVIDKDGDFSFDFNGNKLAGEKPSKTISKRIRNFLSNKCYKDELIKEWDSRGRF